ncbi:hypothetical protein A2U01_0056539, partial [Trifolium medium]|nr:hypothetical protein [Trifolium medium]
VDIPDEWEWLQILRKGIQYKVHILS